VNSEIDKRSIGYKRRISSLKKENDVMIDFLNQAVENDFGVSLISGENQGNLVKANLGN